MLLPDDVLKGLGEQLMHCLARVTQPAGGLPAGAAFFVSDSLLVTNRHVVGAAFCNAPQEVFGASLWQGPVKGTVCRRRASCLT